MALRLFLSLLSLACVITNLQAEIHWIDTLWNPIPCIGNCPNLLEKRLREMRNVSEVQIYPQQGKARLVWQPGKPYSYFMVQSPFSWVGVDISQMAIGVSGRISSDSRGIYLTSTGDHTRFILLGNQAGGVNPDPHNFYFVQGSTEQYPLSPEMTEKLLRAAQTGDVVTVEGTLLMFWQPPLYVNVNQLTLPKRQN